jgi:CheY-like chemotaxis protein
LIDRSQPDAVFLDIVLTGIGGGNGLDALRRIRKAYSNLPIIVLSGRATEAPDPFGRLAAASYLSRRLAGLAAHGAASGDEAPEQVAEPRQEDKRYNRPHRARRGLAALILVRIAEKSVCPFG